MAAVSTWAGGSVGGQSFLCPVPQTRGLPDARRDIVRPTTRIYSFVAFLAKNRFIDSDAVIRFQATARLVGQQNLRLQGQRSRKPGSLSHPAWNSEGGLFLSPPEPDLTSTSLTAK